MPAGANAATELKHEHAVIEGLTTRIATLETGDERGRLVQEAAQRFLTHMRAEELYLYPALRRFLPHGEAEAVDQARHGAAIRNIVDSIDRTDVHDATFDALANQLVIDIQRHIEQQDVKLLPALLQACPLEEINHVGRQLRGGMSDARDGEA
jgi:hemerythrin superfamily protein